MEDINGFFCGICMFCETLVFALWINQPDRLGSLIWALPIMTSFGYTSLYCLAKSDLYKKEK